MLARNGDGGGVQGRRVRLGGLVAVGKRRVGVVATGAMLRAVKGGKVAGG